MQVLSIPKKKRIYALAFSPNNRDLAAACGDGFLRIWDTSTGEVRQWIAIEPTPSGYDIAFLDVDRLVFAGNELRWWDIPANGWNLIRAGYRWAVQIALSPDGRYLAEVDQASSIAGGMSGLLLHDLEAESLVHGMEQTTHTTGGVAFSPDGGRLATGHIELAGHRQRRFGLLSTTYTVNQYDYVVHVRELATGTILQSSDGWQQGIGNLTFSPDGKVLAGTAGPRLRIMDLEGNRELALHKRGTKHFQGIAFTADGRYLASVSNDETVRIWDARSWQEHTTFTWNIGRLLNIAVAPDGLRAAAGSDKGQIVIWDLEE